MCIQCVQWWALLHGIFIKFNKFLTLMCEMIWWNYWYLLAQQVLKTSLQRRKFRKLSRRLGNLVKRHFNDRTGKVVYFHFTCAIVCAGMFLQTDKTAIGITLVDVRPNWLNKFHFLICYSDRLHHFFVTIPRCYQDNYVNSYFPHPATFWNSQPIECFPLTDDLNNRINRQWVTVGSS